MGSDLSATVFKNKGSFGVFADNPISIPKYYQFKTREADFVETMARMFVHMSGADYDKFIAHMKKDSRTEELAKRLVVTPDPNRGGLGYIDFILQSVQHQFREKVDVVETLADNYVAYYFGQAPVEFTYNGGLYNTQQDDQATNMYLMYRDIIRGSRLAFHGKTLTLSYNDWLVTGTVNSFSLGLTADNETWQPFSLQLLVKKIIVIPSKNAGLVTRTGSFREFLVNNNVSPVAAQANTKPIHFLAAPPVRSARLKSSEAAGSEAVVSLAPSGAAVKAPLASMLEDDPNANASFPP